MKKMKIFVSVVLLFVSANSLLAQSQKMYYRDETEMNDLRQNVFGVNAGAIGILVPVMDGNAVYRVGFTGSLFYERRFSNLVALRLPFSLNLYSRNSSIFGTEADRNVDISQLTALGGLGLRFYTGDSYGIEFFVGPSFHFGGVVGVNVLENGVTLSSKEALLMQAFVDAGMAAHLGFFRIEVALAMGYQGDFPSKQNLSPENKFAGKLVVGIGFDF